MARVADSDKLFTRCDKWFWFMPTVFRLTITKRWQMYEKCFTEDEDLESKIKDNFAFFG
jgi:hypothetical protein